MIRLLTLVALLATFSCHPKIEFDSLQAEPKLVIWCFLHPDSVVTASLTKTIPIFETDADKKVTDGIVVIYENNRIWDTLRNDGTDKYISIKGLHPKAGNIYSIKAYKMGFKTLETTNDTMPSKPIVKNWSIMDSVGITDNISFNGKKGVLAKIQLSINTPSNFPIYGVSRIKQTGLSSTFFNKDEVDYYSDDRCPIIRGVSARGFIFKYSNCQDRQGEMNIIVNNYSAQIKGIHLKFKLCATTYQFQRFYYEFRDFENSYREQAFDLYATPITFPEYVKNGYGFFACYNTSNEIDITF